MDGPLFPQMRACGKRNENTIGSTAQNNKPAVPGILIPLLGWGEVKTLDPVFELTPGFGKGKEEK